MVRRTCKALFPLAIGLLAACNRPACEPATRCDITKVSCQHEALRLARCLRGSDQQVEVDLRVISVDDYVAEQIEGSDESPDDGYLDLRRGLSLFSLSVPYDAKADAQREADRIGAYYSSATKRVTVLDRGGDNAAANRVLFLVHEMVHALQDREGHLSLDPVITFDEWLHGEAVIEGEATLVQDHAMVEALGFDFGHIRYARALESYQTREMRELADSNDPYSLASSYVSYPFGTRYVYGAYRRGGNEAVLALYDEIPSRARALISSHGLDRQVEPPIPLLDDATLVASQHLGAFLVETFHRRSGGKAGALLEHVLDDVFAVQRTSDGELIASWRILFDDNVDADAVADRLTRAGDLVSSDGPGDLWIMRASDPGLLPSSPQAVAFGPAPEVDYGFVLPTTEGASVRCRVRQGNMNL